MHIITTSKRNWEQNPSQLHVSCISTDYPFTPTKDSTIPKKSTSTGECISPGMPRYANLSIMSTILWNTYSTSHLYSGTKDLLNMIYLSLYISCYTASGRSIYLYRDLTQPTRVSTISQSSVTSLRQLISDGTQYVRPDK